MANVVDPNSWRMFPSPDSHPSRPTRSGAPRLDHARESGVPEISRLAAALRRAFDASSDQVTWHLETAQDERQFRVDGSHTPRENTAAPAAHSGAGDPPWHVLVQTVHQIAGENGAPEVGAALEHEGCLLLVVCGVTEAGPNTNEQRQLAERLAVRFHLRFVESATDSTEERLSGLLTDIKRSGSSSVLYLDAAAAPPAPHFSVTSASSGSDVPERTYRDCALEMLRALQAANEEIVCLAAETAGEDPVALLVRCQTLASAGHHPFAFLSLEEALDNLSVLRRVFSVKPAPITLVLESVPQFHALARSSGLAPLRELENICLLAPKDGRELNQMLVWCARQGRPSIVWLPEPHLPAVSWPAGEDIAFGQSERLGTGADVAIVAWGATNAAAAIAAECLAQLEIRATVLNARFAQPLDVDGLLHVCAASAYTVILDDAGSGGFAAWVSEALIRRGLTPNIAIVSAESVTPADALDGPQLLAGAVVERCRWLGQHLAEPNMLQDARVEPVAAACPAQTASEPALLLTELAGTPDVQAQVLATQFSPFIEQWVQRYARVGSRDVYLWRWCLHGLDLTTLSCVAPVLRRDLCDTKLLAVMYGVMLDDVADHAGGEAFLAALTGIISGSADRDFSAFSSEQQEYARFTCELWDTFRSRLQASPCYAEYAEILDYDHQQILNTFAYSLLVNKRLALLNVQEHDMYQPHNMQMMSFATMDLMCSPQFDRREVGRLREVIWHAQSMGRIGNLVSTWQREVADRDFTSGVFARALREGDLSLEDLASAPPAEIEAAVRRGQHEQYFLQKWEAHWQTIASLATGIRSVDVRALLRSLAQLLRMELNSRGFK